VGIGGPNGRGYPEDRRVMETELTEKGLPEGSISKPVCGYLYFPIPEKLKKGTHQIEFSGNGQKILLELKTDK
jgi:hypothetical protein